MNRYPGIQPFQSSQSDLFKGREDEKRELLNLIILHPLVVLFSKSGIGKTSLLQAGISPQMPEHRLMPIFIRLNLTDYSPENQVYEALREQGYLSSEVSPGLTLWEYLKKARFVKAGKPYTPVLIFDQFEELFTLYTPEQRNSFVEQFADLVNSRMPDHLRENLDVELDQLTPRQITRRESSPEVKVILSIRSDRLSLLDQLSGVIPSILRCRYELKELDEKNAKKAILEPANAEGKFITPPFQYSELALEEILDFLKGSNSDPKTQPVTETIESFQLQLLCSHIENLIAIAPFGNEKNTVTADFYGYKEGLKSIVKEFYNDSLKAFPKSRKDVIQKTIEDGLTSDNKRISVDETFLIKKYGITEIELKKLVDRRVLRKEPRLGSFYYEISHDTLLSPITESLRERVRLNIEAEQREVIRLERQKKYRALRRVLFSILTVALTSLIVAVWALDQKSRADEQRNNANKQKKIADEQRELIKIKLDSIQSLKGKLEKVNSIAEQDKVEAQKQRSAAKRSEKKAQKALKKAEIEKDKAIEEKKNAKIAEENAYAAQRYAEEQEGFAKIEKKKAESSSMFAASQTNIAKNSAEKTNKALNILERQTITLDSTISALDSTVLILENEKRKVLRTLSRNKLSYHNANKFRIRTYGEGSRKKHVIEDEGGKSIIGKDYDEFSTFDSDGYSYAKRSGKYYLVDTIGNEYIVAKDIQSINKRTELIDLRNEGLKDFPKAILEHPNLKVILLNENNIGSIPANIKSMSKLIRINLAGNNISTIPIEIGELAKIEHIDLSWNFIDSIPQNLILNKNMQSIDLSWNELNRIPNFIYKLHKLKILNINNNNLRKISTGVKNLSLLEKVNLSNNKIEKLPNEIIAWLNIKLLLLGGNTIKNIPTKINNLEKLEIFDISGNLLRNIPQSIGKLSELKMLDISKNNLDTLPNLSKLKKLKTMNIASNDLTEIPEIWQANDLKLLDLSDNEITSIPSDIKKLKKLKSLNLSDNKIEIIPEDIKKIKRSLKSLRIANNKLKKGELEKAKKLLPNCVIGTLK